MISALLDMLIFGFAVVGIITVFVVTAILYLAQAGNRNCGCGAVVDGRWGYDTIEETTEWKRSTRGAKVQWRKVKRELRRCEKCGDHYHTDEVEVLEEREAWPEEEPHIMPERDELVGVLSE